MCVEIKKVCKNFVVGILEWKSLFTFFLCKGIFDKNEFSH